MTSHEKAVAAVNRRLERLQANLAETKNEAAQQFLVQSLVVTVGVNDAFLDYLKAIERFAQRRHAELNLTKEGLEAKHAELLATGQKLLERFKEDPTDRAVRKEIERIQKDMEGVQKELRRGANRLQREMSGSLGLVDPMADNLRRFSESDQIEGMKRLIGQWVGQVRDFYADAVGRLERGLIDAETWENAAVTEVTQTSEFYDAYARTGFQLVLALELLSLSLAEAPPTTAAEAIGRAKEAATARLKEVAARLSSR